MNKQNRIILILFLLTVVVITLWFFSTRPQRDYEYGMDILYSTINGRIEYFENDRGVAIIRLKNQDEHIHIVDILDENGHPTSFQNYIQIGDSLFSPYASDSIYVFRENKKYGYRIAINYAE